MTIHQFRSDPAYGQRIAAPRRSQQPGVRETLKPMNHNEWQTDDSILAAPADEATEQAADLVIAAADEHKLTPAKLGQLLVSVGRTVSDEDDLLTLLQRVVEIAHDAIDGADSTSLTIDLGGRTYTAVHTDDRTLRVDSEQYDAGDGPCLEASRTGAVVLVNADDPEDRWPRFTAAAREEEILSFLAAPLITGEQSLGSFNLYGHARSAFDTLDAEILELLTTTVSRTLGDFARFKSARDVADSIQRALQTRAPIEQAKGILMALHGVDADEAFDLLRRESQATNTRLHTVATELVTRLSSPATDDSPTTEISPDCSH
jgi:transcriptional regulator with GAF, ATPase, and Fis domain